jgi:hypothetical protein
MRQCRILPRFKDRDHSSVFPHCREVVGEENRIENLGQEGYRSPGKMLHDHVWDIVCARSLADFKIHDGLLNLVRFG